VKREHNPLFLILPFIYGGLAGYLMKRKPIGVFREVTVGGV
jgi:uncharacterized membrane protein YeaQ/YmgE (transglycosylase-associated protein family)